MSTCEQWNCPGHLGKFDSCRDEALYDLALAMSGTGDVEFDGYFSEPIVIESDERVASTDLGSVTVPAGIYIVQTENSGAVSVWTFDTLDAARQTYAHFDSRYSAWSDDEQDEMEPFVCAAVDHGYEVL